MPTVATVGITARKSVSASGSLIVDDENLVTQTPLDGVGLLSEERVAPHLETSALLGELESSTIQADGNSRPPSQH
jgi:hypothetical protein